MTRYVFVIFDEAVLHVSDSFYNICVRLLHATGRSEGRREEYGDDNSTEAISQNPKSC